MISKFLSPSDVAEDPETGDSFALTTLLVQPTTSPFSHP
jgi:hypothetical protein